MMEDSAPLHLCDASLSQGVIEAFTAATIAAFQELCATELAAGEPIQVDAVQTGDVFAVLTLQRVPSGQLVLAFPRGMLETLTARYLGDDIVLTDELVDDAAGEFANVIAGQAKTMLKGHPAHYLITPPRVQRSSIATEQGSWLLLPFPCELGTLLLHLRLPI